MRDQTEAIEHNLCKLCAGEGERFGERCWPCRGSGWIKKSDCVTKKISLNNEQTKGLRESSKEMFGTLGKTKLKGKSSGKLDL